MLKAVPSAEIDPDGTFKYILVKVYAPQTPDGTEPSKIIVRGNKRGPYHADIYDETVKVLTELKLDSECIGGGKIQHNSAEKKINIFGSSQGFGKADHQVAAQILQEVFPGYEITCNDDKN